MVSYEAMSALQLSSAGGIAAGSILQLQTSSHATHRLHELSLQSSTQAANQIHHDAYTHIHTPHCSTSTQGLLILHARTTNAHLYTLEQ